MTNSKEKLVAIKELIENHEDNSVNDNLSPAVWEKNGMVRLYTNSRLSRKGKSDYIAIDENGVVDMDNMSDHAYDVYHLLIANGFEVK